MIKKFGLIALSLMTMLVSIFSSCKFWSSLEEPTPPAKQEIKSLKISKNELDTQVGDIVYLNISITPRDIQKEIKLEWSYDDKIIKCDTSSPWGITITGIKEGQTQLKCSYGGYDASCIVRVKGFGDNAENTVEPYIYSNYSTLQMAPSVTEKVSVSLFGGNSGDVGNYQWIIDNPSVASIQPTGQYCLITGKGTGYARIKVTHPKAVYPYYIGVYVFADATKVKYITTDNNVVTMNQEDSERTITVDLVNGDKEDAGSIFGWEILPEENNKEVPIKLEHIGNTAIVSPVGSGSCTIRVTHPSASYPLDILCRVITVVKNVYIEPEKTIININGNKSETLSSTLKNIEEPNNYLSDYTFDIQNSNVAKIDNSVGNQVTIKGIANGSTKLIISHPKAKYKREVLVIVEGQLTDAIDTNVFITTSQNYIQTKVGNDVTKLNIELKGGEIGDEKDFTWTVSQYPNDKKSEVIKLETVNGNVALSRIATSDLISGKGIITPVSEGTAVISISHPKVLYPTEIMIKVFNKEAILDSDESVTNEFFLSGSSLIKILNGNTFDYEVSLNGEKKEPNDVSQLKWTVQEGDIKIVASDNIAQITAPAKGSGNVTSKFEITHPKVKNPKHVAIISADTEEELAKVKALYTDKEYHNLKLNEKTNLIVNHTGFDYYDPDKQTNIKYDFSRMLWKVEHPSLINVKKDPANPLICNIEALGLGQTTITASIDGYSCSFVVTIYPEDLNEFKSDIYFTTTQNIVTVKEHGSSKVEVSAINLPYSEYSNISWQVEDSNICSVIPNGASATIEGLKEGETVINVSHKLCQNILKIYIKVGNNLIIKNEPTVYISSQDVLTFLRDDPATKLQAMLVNYKTDKPVSGFKFEIDKPVVAEIITQAESGLAYIKPVSSGQAEITITNPESEMSKKVLVLVGNSKEELEGLTYLTTNNNVVAVGEGNTSEISVTVKNTKDVVLDGWNWESSNPECISVTDVGGTAVLKGNSVGTSLITVSNKNCKYPLTIIAQCVDPIAATENPYIQLTSSVITLNTNDGYTNVTADLIGGSSSDYSSFVWSSNDSDICSIYGQNEIGKLKALKEGTTYINVTHPKAMYPAQILVVCEETKQSECYISVPSSVINLKPTGSAQEIRASLINGSATDKYNFKWSLDVYDIVDIQYSANSCIVTPKTSGSCTLTVSHPKAAYDQQIIINVQEFNNFSFPSTNMTITQGDVKFLNMEVPITKLASHVEYSVLNEKICSITGTKDVAQITGIGSGTTTVKAKLIASSTGTVQAEADMMVYVKEKELDQVYITTGNTINTIKKGKSQTLSAQLSGSGVSVNDSSNLVWTTTDTDIIQITGISQDGTIKGNQIYVTALKPGEALITCSHEKAPSTLQFYVLVPGTTAPTIKLNKSFLNIQRNTNGATLKATIENIENSSDYNKIVWTAHNKTGDTNTEIVRIMGSGQEVTIYPRSAGEATVTASLNDEQGNLISKATCTVMVQEINSFMWETTQKMVQPFETVKVKYTVSPKDSQLEWTTTQMGSYFEFNDLGYDSKTGIGYVEITGLKLGNGKLFCMTNHQAKGTLSIKVDWDYNFSIKGSTAFNIRPDETMTYTYAVKPRQSVIDVNSSDMKKFDCQIITETEDVLTNTKTGKIIISPNCETPNAIDLTVTATNPTTGEVFSTKQMRGKFEYDKLSLIGNLLTKNGNFSRYDHSANALVIGDGEKVSLKFTVPESKVEWRIESLQLQKVDPRSKNRLTVNVAKDNIIEIENTEDVKEIMYYIPEFFVPVYHGIELSPSRHFYWDKDDVGFMNFSAGYNLTLTGIQKVILSTNENGFITYDETWSNIRKPEKDGTYISISEYENTPWYWQRTPVIKHWNGKVAYGARNEATGNQPAVKRTSPNKTIVSNKITDKLSFNVVHNGKSDRITINVVTEVRNCDKNQK